MKSLFLSVLALFLAMAAVILVNLPGPALINAILPGSVGADGFPLTAAAQLLFLPIIFLAGTAGAFVVVFVAPRSPVVHAVVFGALAVVGDIVVVAGQADVWPVWFSTLIVVTVPPQIWLGAVLGLRARRRWAPWGRADAHSVAVSAIPPALAVFLTLGSMAQPATAQNELLSTTLSADTLHYTTLIEGQVFSRRQLWRKCEHTWQHEGDSPPFLGTERIVLDADGLPARIEVSTQGPTPQQERFERNAGRVTWSVSVSGDSAGVARETDAGEAVRPGPAYYLPLLGWHDAGFLARALLRRPDLSLPLLPAGVARLEQVGVRSVELEGRTRAVKLYAIHGIEVVPVHVWLDDSDLTTFADGYSVRSEWEPSFQELRTAIDSALAEHDRRMAAELVPAARQRPLAICGALLFDPHSGTVRPGTTIVVEGTRIVSVDGDASASVPDGSEVIEARGRTVIPGLWDMHAHHGVTAFPLEQAPLHLAAGVTTARNMESPMEWIIDLQRRIEAGEAVGPRLVLAGFINGAGGWPGGAMVSDAAEASAAVDRYAESGHRQVKTYRQLPIELVPAVIERARELGLRVGGYPLDGMTVREMADLGYDEIHGVDVVLEALEPPGGLEPDDGAPREPDPDVLRELVGYLAARGVALDAMVMGMDPWCMARGRVEALAARLPAPAGRRLLVNSRVEPCPPEEALDLRLRAVRSAHDAGVPVLPGAPWLPGFGLHDELDAYVRAGIPAPDVLTFATLGAARVMGMDGELGSIEPGKLADFVIVDGDPMTDFGELRRVDLVVKDGRVYDPAAIYRALGIQPCCEE